MIKSNIISAKEVRAVANAALPEGEYKGTWGGYEAVFEVEGKTYLLRTENGIRCISCPCLVRVKDGIVRVEAES